MEVGELDLWARIARAFEGVQKQHCQWEARLESAASRKAWKLH